jgi:hypothetical protein
VTVETGKRDPPQIERGVIRGRADRRIKLATKRVGPIRKYRRWRRVPGKERDPANEWTYPPVADTTASESDTKNEVIEADVPVLATLEAVLAEEPTVPSPLPEAPSPLPEPTTWPARLPSMTVPPSERDEIKQRLASFKALQLKMQAEREDYYLQTITRIRALAQYNRHFAFGRVEDGRGSLGRSATLRFPSPLIEPDVPD